jgi:hypothetical protein
MEVSGQLEVAFLRPPQYMLDERQCETRGLFWSSREEVTASAEIKLWSSRHFTDFLSQILRIYFKF